MKKLDKAERKTLIVWSIFGIIFVILAILIKIEYDKPTILPIIKEKKVKYVSVKDYSRYYTVKNTLTKFYTFINTNKYESIINILDKKYIKDNNIDTSNVKDKLGIKDDNLVLETRIMYEYQKKDGIVSYLVSAKEVGKKKTRDVYYEVTLNGNTYRFTIKPLAKDEYMEVFNE